LAALQTRPHSIDYDLWLPRLVAQRIAHKKSRSIATSGLSAGGIS
jgi:hypothetical protein